MLTLVVGGAASGKSGLAEAFAGRYARGEKIYIATMEPFGEESLRRIEKHRAMRAGKGFRTVECYRDLQEVALPSGSTVLLECMGNLCANELYGEAPEGAEERILEGVKSLAEQCAQLVIVSNEVCSGGTDYLGDTLSYLKLLGKINCALAGLADNVCEAVCGLPVWHKGGWK